jgi:DNA-binding CsgD family transcriptional regulator
MRKIIKFIIIVTVPNPKYIWDNDWIRGRLSTGATQYTVASELGRPRVTVCKHIAMVNSKFGPIIGQRVPIRIPWDDDKIMANLKKGMTQKEICEELEYSKHSLQELIAKLRSPDFHLNIGNTIIDWDDEKIIELADQCKDMMEVATALGYKHSTLLGHMKKLCPSYEYQNPVTL